MPTTATPCPDCAQHQASVEYWKNQTLAEQKRNTSNLRLLAERTAALDEATSALADMQTANRTLRSALGQIVYFVDTWRLQKTGSGGLQRARWLRLGQLASNALKEISK